MSEHTAIGLIGAAAVVVFTALSVALLALGGGGGSLVVALGLVGLANGVAVARVIKHYQSIEERRKREEILLSR